MKEKMKKRELDLILETIKTVKIIKMNNLYKNNQLKSKNYKINSDNYLFFVAN